MPKSKSSPLVTAHFRFALIAPVIQGTYSDASASAYYRRVTQKPLTLPDGSLFHYQPRTLEKWVEYYKKGGMDALMPKVRSDKGSTRTLTDTAIEEIYRLRQKYPRLNATQIHVRLIQDAFIPASVSVASVQRFIRKNDLKSARNLNIRDRKAFEEEFFGGLWQADTCYLPYISEDGKYRRTYLIMIIDDHSRLIVGGRIFYHDNSYHFQKVLKDAIASYGIPNKLYLDNGSSYSNDQLTLICGSVGTLELHTPVRDGASKGKVERNFRTLKNRWLYGLDTSQLHSLAEFNEELASYIRTHNTTIHSTTKQTPLDRFLASKEHIRIPKSSEWLDECFHNRIMRKVNKDASITIDGIYYDVPQQFIGMKVEIRFLPDDMADAYVLYDNNHYPIRRTDRVVNGKTKRNHSLPSIDYSRKEGQSHV
jgi:transposase InsO family protein